MLHTRAPTVINSAAVAAVATFQTQRQSAFAPRDDMCFPSRRIMRHAAAAATLAFAFIHCELDLVSGRRPNDTAAAICRGKPSVLAGYGLVQQGPPDMRNETATPPCAKSHSR